MNEATNFEKDSAKQSRNNLAALLQQAGTKDVHRRQIKCPFHRDNTPSAELRQAKSGVWYFYCYVCDIADDYFALKARVEGRQIGDILKDEKMIDYKPQRKTNFVANGESFSSFDEMIAVWQKRNPNAVLQEKNPYTDPVTDKASYYTLRILPAGSDKKEFRQASEIGGRWYWKQPEGKLPLFNRKRILECDNVVIFEGEKCVREFTKLGFENYAATTAPQGANGAAKADWSICNGKNCFTWRDYDEPGIKYESEAINALLKLQCQVRRVRVDELELEPKQDVVDYLETVVGTNSEKRAAIELVLQDAEPLNVTSALEERITLIERGTFRNIIFPQFPRMSDLSKALMPGTVLTICGEPGAGKSFLMLESFWRWSLETDEKVKLFMFEDDDAFHQNRALAQMSGYADLTDVDFCADNIEFYRQVFQQYRPRLEWFSRNLTTAKSEQKTLDEVAEWVKIQAEAGASIIGVDPITAAKVSDKPYIDDQRFLFKVKETVERTGARLIITTHPRLGQAGKPSLSGMAGGAAYPRFSQTVLWLKNLDKPETSTVWFNGRTTDVNHKQVLEIRKARNGKGQGNNLAAQLNFQNLCFDELGIIQEKVS